MTKKIAFRAWDGKRLSKPFSFENICEPMGMRGKFVCDLIGKENKRYYFNIKKCKFIQFTGLKDKNGKEIFEGDICIDNDSKDLVVVEFMDGAFWFVFDKENRFTYDWVTKQTKWHCEVIGNKFENPKLLK